LPPIYAVKKLVPLSLFEKQVNKLNICLLLFLFYQVLYH
jgi:hypothetical protein